MGGSSEAVDELRTPSNRTSTDRGGATGGDGCAERLAVARKPRRHSERGEHARCLYVRLYDDDDDDDDHLIIIIIIIVIVVDLQVQVSYTAFKVYAHVRETKVSTQRWV